ncbi:hypothetical protein MKZ38_003907 [Zalerion maritima]|uniref:PD-(D/E)XK nuclease-like domain-containing protein n=1 Tax=Zalerion maritima TaxID=339359 RepID=A0AAD5RTK6_9PEZI|nr:hypothetical protein MKZ38_003907 [Zalerion maritima]
MLDENESEARAKSEATRIPHPPKHESRIQHGRRLSGDKEQTPRAGRQQYKEHMLRKGTNLGPAPKFTIPTSDVASDAGSGYSKDNPASTLDPSASGTSSRAYSPTKRKARLALDDDAGDVVRFKLLDYDTLVDPVQATLDPIYKASLGQPFLPTSLKSSIASFDLPSFRPRYHFNLPFLTKDSKTDIDTHQSSYPPPKIIRNLVKSTIRTANQGHEEAGWSTIVDLEVLKLAYTNVQEDPDDLDSDSESESEDEGEGEGEHAGRHESKTRNQPSSPVRERRKQGRLLRRGRSLQSPPLSGAALTASRDATLERIRLLARQRATGTPNNTDFASLSGFPICLAIETKRLGEAMSGVEVQPGIWQSAHWEFYGGSPPRVRVRDRRRWPLYCP